MNRQRQILALLLVLFVIALGWSYRSVPRQKTVAELPTATPQKSISSAVKRPVAAAPEQPKQPLTAPADVRKLRLDLLTQPAERFSGYRRNLFQPIFFDELLQAKKILAKPVAPPPVKPVPPPPPAPTPPPAAENTEQRELARFTFLGFLKKDNKKTIFLSQDKNILLVRTGDKFGGRYEAASITEQALSIRVTDTGEEIVIPLLENKPLGKAPKSPAAGS